MTDRRPIVIDCDPGMDDAVCLLMMMADDRFDIKGITPVGGNQTIEIVTRNALALCELAGRSDIPVAKGASGPILRKLETAAYAHGASGLGGVTLPDPKTPVADIDAADLIFREAGKAMGQLELLAVGPLTNVATAILRYPELKNMIGEITVMGGGVWTGNHTATAEYNIFADPEGAKVVFNSGIRINMMGLDICEKATVSADELPRIKGGGGPIRSVVAQLIGERVERSIAQGGSGAILCDAVAAAYLINPSLIRTGLYHVDVETKGPLSTGRTVVDYYYGYRRGTPNTRIGLDIDRPAFVELIATCLDALEPDDSQVIAWRRNI